MFNAYAKIDPDPDQGTSPLEAVSTKKPANPLKISTLYLQAADIGSFLRVQESVRPTLLKPYHLKERTAEDVEAHFGERMPLIGARAYTSEMKHGTLVAGCLLSFLKNHEAVKNLDGYPVTEEMMPVTAVVQSLCVNPAYAGNKISQLVLSAATSAAQQNGMTNLISAIADDNPASIKAFREAGYEAFARGTDPKQGYAKTYYRLGL